ncbi:MAG: hypothetical protein ABI641_08705 [Caldimonas sp.]
MTFDESFASAQATAFAFLVAEHGFRAVVNEVTRENAEDGVVGRFVYEDTVARAPRRTVSLKVAPLRLQLSLDVARVAAGSFTIEEVHAVDGRGPFPRREHGLYDAMDSPELLLAEFVRLAGVLEAAGARFFADEADFWEDLRDLRERRADVEEIKRILALSRTAFHDRDWALVIDLLGPIERRLGSTATGRLAYARRHLAGAA